KDLGLSLARLEREARHRNRAVNAVCGHRSAARAAGPLPNFTWNGKSPCPNGLPSLLSLSDRIFRVHDRRNQAGEILIRHRCPRDIPLARAVNRSLRMAEHQEPAGAKPAHIDELAAAGPLEAGIHRLVALMHQRCRPSVDVILRIRDGLRTTIRKVDLELDKVVLFALRTLGHA